MSDRVLAKAFNMWMDDYTNNPEAYEQIHTVAIRHLKEKLDGEVPSYGEEMAEIFQGYLEKVV